MRVDGECNRLISTIDRSENGAVPHILEENDRTSFVLLVLAATLQILTVQRKP
jgi:hypothetical protein